MLKILFGLLLAINAGLLAFQQGWIDSPFESRHEPSRMEQQLNQDKLHIVAPAPVVIQKAAVETAPVVAPPVAQENASDAAPAQPAPQNVTVCTELGNFETADAQRFEARLATLKMGDRIKRLAVQENMRHIVFIPPLGSKEAADRKGAELKQMGVTDYFVIQDGSPLQWGISLGIFRSEESARNHLASLSQKGVRSAKVGTHGLGGNRVAFQMRGLDVAQRQSIDQIRQDFPRQQWRECTEG